MVRFYLERAGERVADGVVFSDGAAALRFLGPTASTNCHDSIERLMVTHGHEGTTFVWIDAPPAPREPLIYR